MDLEVLTLPDGKKYVRKPRGVYFEPSIFLKVMAAAVLAHKEGLP